MVQISCHYHYWFWSYDKLLLSGIYQKSGNRKNPVWVLRNIWRLGWVRDTKSGMDVSDEMLLNPENHKEYSFYRFRVIKGKPTGGVGKITPILTHIRVNNEDLV